MTKINRSKAREGSNNEANANQNVCALMVATALNVQNEVRYLHVIDDLKRAISSKHSLRSVKSMVKSDTVGGARKNLDGQNGATAYMVWVDGHVLLLGADGATIVDTDPRQRDRRKIKGIWGVYSK
tara:strand:- start:358 stop:735 length:378 start_codon:yes stop_codon:yes gene_type:complete